MILATFYDHIVEISRQEGLSMADALGAARALGVRRVEVSQNNILGREDEVSRELAAAGLGVSAIASYFDFGRDPDVDRQSGPTLAAARYLGADKLLVIPGFWGPADSPARREEQVLNMIAGVRRLADRAAALGISLVMEEYDNALAPFSSAAQVKRFLDGCPGLSCCFDTGNFLFAGDDVLAAYDLLRPHIRHVHLKDRASRSLHGEPGVKTMAGRMVYPCSVGDGQLPIRTVLDRLRADGYQGTLAIEHYHAARQLPTLRRSAAWLLNRAGGWGE